MRRRRASTARASRSEWCEDAPRDARRVGRLTRAGRLARGGAGGEKGYFRIRRGTNEGGIEDQVVGSSASATWGKKSLLDARK